MKKTILLLMTILLPNITMGEMPKESLIMKNREIYIKKSQLEQVFEEMMDNIEDGKLKTMLMSKFDKFRNDFNDKTISYCINKYIEAEMDFQTPGVRGIGRVSDQISRLGGYYRKELSQIDSIKREMLYNLIQDTMLKAYLTGVLMLSEDLKDAKILVTFKSYGIMM